MADWTEKCLTCRKSGGIPRLGLAWACIDKECHYEPQEDGVTITVSSEES